MEFPTERSAILIVDDEKINFDYINWVLKKHEFDIYHAKNGLEAVEFCRTIPNIKFVFMDLCMPVMDGYEATIKIHEFLPDLPIVAVTATPNEFLEDALASGCIEAYSKPISKEQLLNLVEHYMPGSKT